ncbi:MAG: sporulation protein YunB [Oscillospiraceae bacterium]|nr:sporulation protein YunB [Oscillospiraceae bacterium]
MRVKKKKSKLRRKIRKISLVFLSLFIGIIVFFEYQAVPFQEKYVRTQARIISNNAITEAVNDVINRYNFSYKDISVINYNSDGKVTSIETNSININILKAELNKAVQEKIETVTDADVSVHIGAFTELSLLSNFGPKVTFDFTFVGSFNSEIVSTFESAGLNQTVHHIKFIVNATLITLSPDYSDGIEYTTDFEIAQSVIAGDIPGTYANIGKYG